MIKTISILCLFLLPLRIFSQGVEPRILVKNTTGSKGIKSISVKWYSPELLYKEGVNIYRKEGSSDWVKLNSQPIKKAATISREEIDKDPQLDFFLNFVNASKKEDLKGFHFINVLVKSFESTEFSKFLGIMYEDVSIEQGISYQYKVMKLVSNAEVLLGISSSIVAAPEKADIPLKDITVAEKKKKVLFTWKPEEDRFYAVNFYRKSNLDNNFTKINKEPIMLSKTKDSLGRLVYPKVMYEDTTVREGVSYSYKLAGVDFFGKETEHSGLFPITIKDVTPPSHPLNLKDSVNNLSVLLKWENKKDADIAGLNVYRSAKSDGPYTKVNPLPLAPQTNSLLDKVGKAGPYYYYVASFDLAGNEGRSDKIFVEVHDIIPPAIPTGVIIKADTGRIELKWQNNKEPDLMGYRIYKSQLKKGKEEFILVNSAPISQTYYQETMPKVLKMVKYYVVAVDSSYNKSKPTAPVVAKLPDILPPEKPFIKKTSIIESGLLIEWLPNVDTDLKGYILQRSPIELPHKFISLHPDHLVKGRISFEDRTLEQGKNYLYCVYALDSAGNKSAASNIYPASLPVSKQLTAVPSDISLKADKDKRSIEINWKYKRKIQTDGFVVYKSIGEKGYPLPVSKLLKETSFVDRDVKQGEVYAYEVRAYDPNGTFTRSEIQKIKID